MKKYVLNIGVLIVLNCTIASAQFEFSGELRFRPEMRYGYKQLPDSGDSPAFFTSQRSRLNFNLTKEKYAVCIALQDVRIWGDENKYSSTGIKGDDSSIDLKEAWFSYQLKENLFVKAGRQEFKYADQRLLAARNWNQYGMSYDALLFSYKDKFQLDAGFSYNNNSELVYQDLYSLDKLRTLDFLYLRKEVTQQITVEGLYILTGFQKPEDKEGMFLKNTLGAIAVFKSDKFELKGSGYYQNGLNNQGQNVSAWLLNGNAKIKIAKYEIILGSDILSGQNSTNTNPGYQNTAHRFDLLYGARHSYYGEMDYFSNFNSNLTQGGLVDLFLTTKFPLGSKLDLKVCYHYLSMQNSVADPTILELPVNTLEKYLASEVDTKISYSVNELIKLDLGYSIMKGSQSLNKLQKGNSTTPNATHWVWMMLTVKPVLFEQ